MSEPLVEKEGERERRRRRRDGGGKMSGFVRVLRGRASEVQSGDASACLQPPTHTLVLDPSHSLAHSLRHASSGISSCALLSCTHARASLPSASHLLSLSSSFDQKDDRSCAHSREGEQGCLSLSSRLPVSHFLTCKAVISVGVPSESFRSHSLVSMLQVTRQ